MNCAPTRAAPEPCRRTPLSEVWIERQGFLFSIRRTHIHHILFLGYVRGEFYLQIMTLCFSSASGTSCLAWPIHPRQAIAMPGPSRDK